MAEALLLTKFSKSVSYKNLLKDVDYNERFGRTVKQRDDASAKVHLHCSTTFSIAAAKGEPAIRIRYILCTFTIRLLLICSTPPISCKVREPEKPSSRDLSSLSDRDLSCSGDERSSSLGDEQSSAREGEDFS